MAAVVTMPLPLQSPPFRPEATIDSMTTPLWTMRVWFDRSSFPEPPIVSVLRMLALELAVPAERIRQVS